MIQKVIYFVSNEPAEEICIVDEFQRRGTMFPLNYNTFCKLNIPLSPKEVPKVIGADGGDLGSMGSVELTLILGMNKVKQEFIMCREL